MASSLPAGVHAGRQLSEHLEVLSTDRPVGTALCDPWSHSYMCLGRKRPSSVVYITTHILVFAH